MANIPGSFYGYAIYITKPCKQFRIDSRGKMKRASIWIGNVPGIY